MLMIEYEGTRVPVRPEMTLGRSAYSSLVLASSSVSRRHAVLHLVEGGAEIEDLGSHNGTRLNGERVEGRAPVGHDDKIVLGDCVLQVIDTAKLGAGPAVRSTQRRVIRMTPREDPGPISLHTSLALLEAHILQLSETKSRSPSTVVRRTVESLVNREQLPDEIGPRLMRAISALEKLSPDPDIENWAAGCRVMLSQAGAHSSEHSA